MNRFQKAALVFFALALLGAIAVLAIQSSNPAPPPPASDLEDLGPAPSFVLKSSTGEQFDSKSLIGRVWVADFFFSNCRGICPMLAASMKQVQDQTADHPNIRLVSLSVDPARDTPEVLTKYGKAVGADPARWSFLIGVQNQVSQISTQGFNLGATEVPGQILHSNRLVLMDKRGEIRGYFVGTNRDDIARLIESAKRLDSGASN